MKPEDLKVADAANYVDGSADVNGETLDMANSEWAIAIVKLAAVAASAVTSIKWQQSSDDSTWNDLEGTATSIAADDDNQVFVSALTKPRDRYVRIVIDKDGSNNAAASATYVVGGNRTCPALQSVTDDVTVAIHHSPAEGTA